MFQTREPFRKRRGTRRDEDENRQHTRKQEDHKFTRLWHERIRHTPNSVPLAELFRKYRLNHVEQEVLMALLADSLGLLDCRIIDVGDVLQFLAFPAGKMLKVLRCMAETGRLFRAGLVFCEDHDEDLREKKVRVDPTLTEMLVKPKQSGREVSPIRREKDLQPFLFRLSSIIQKKSSEMEDIQRGFPENSFFQKSLRKLDRMVYQLEEALETHPTWKLAKVRHHIGLKGNWIMLLALMGKALGHLRHEEKLFLGAGLSRAACSIPAEYNLWLESLMSDAPLLKQDYIRPCGGIGVLLAESNATIQETEYELTENALQQLGLDKNCATLAKKDTSFREPQIRMSNLILSEKTHDALNLALSHVRGAETILKKWGLGSTFSYGRGVTMLFYGPPGTGKTAVAEAMAHELRKPFLVADYSKIQNCFVGETEKNIMKVFRNAARHDAVLFWDEADAMFFDRESAGHTWEIRDVNVLLQQIERFEGMCILATNRKGTLDKALERRITAKIEFPRPDRVLREKIWCKLLPGSMPVASDVELTVLSDTDLSGGEIKNVILNASRMAYGRSEVGPVTMDDFQRAIRMEKEGSWSRSTMHSIGFQRAV